MISSRQKPWVGALLLIAALCLAPAYAKFSKKYPKTPADSNDAIGQAIIGSGMILLTSDYDGPPGQEDGIVETFEDVDPITNIHLQLKGNWRDYFYPWNLFKDAYKSPIHHDHILLPTALGLKALFDQPTVILGGDDTLDYNDVVRWYSKYLDIENSYGNSFALSLTGSHTFDFPLPPPPPPRFDQAPWVPKELVFRVGLKVVSSHFLFNPALPVPYHYTCSCTEWPCPSCCPTDSDPLSPTYGVVSHPHGPQADHGCYDGKDVENAFKAQRIDVKKKDPLNGDVELKIIYKDRTPPRIFQAGFEFPPADTFPNLGTPPDPVTGLCGPQTATTGDFYSPGTLIATDNSGGKIFSCFGIGRLNGPDTPGWTPSPTPAWGWVGSIGVTLPGGGLASHVFLPNDCLGEMKYTVFAWDADGVLNPGEPKIEENLPDLCYQLRGGSPLGTNPGTAVGFPFMATAPAPIRTADLETHVPPIGISQHIEDGEGTIWIDDNDRPNLVIRVKSMRDPNDVLFFPPVGAASVTTVSDTLVPGDDYSKFIENASIRVEDMTDDYTPDFQLLDINLDKLSIIEKGWRWKFGLGPNVNGELLLDPQFFRKQFRLENFSCSDNDLFGNPIVEDERTFGERNGFGQGVAIAHKVPLVEDVEYEITVWAEDNVHFINWPMSGKRIDSPFSGVERGGFVVNVPNQVPPLMLQKQWRKDTYKSEPLRVVFREPTQGNPGPGMTPGTLQAKFPSVSATVLDYRGNERSLTVYFEVSDEKTRVRVLEQRHKKGGD